MDRIIELFAQYGALGIVAGVSLAAYIKLSGKLVSIIENNTRAMERLTAIITSFQRYSNK